MIMQMKEAAEVGGRREGGRGGRKEMEEERGKERKKINTVKSSCKGISEIRTCAFRVIEISTYIGRCFQGHLKRGIMWAVFLCVGR